jgi:hypothetical protein
VQLPAHRLDVRARRVAPILRLLCQPRPGFGRASRVKSLRSHLSVSHLAALAAGGARPGGPPPLPAPDPYYPALEVDRTVNTADRVSLAGQKITVGRLHAGSTVTVYVADTTLAIDLGDDTRTVRRTTSRPVRVSSQSPPTPQGHPYFLAQPSSIMWS